jgi:uncharacterized membrane protein YGL010W
MKYKIHQNLYSLFDQDFTIPKLLYTWYVLMRLCFILLLQLFSSNKSTISLNKFLYIKVNFFYIRS